jgi:hypothetical protein
LRRRKPTTGSPTRTGKTNTPYNIGRFGFTDAFFAPVVGEYAVATSTFLTLHSALYVLSKKIV